MRCDPFRSCTPRGVEGAAGPFKNQGRVGGIYSTITVNAEGKFHRHLRASNSFTQQPLARPSPSKAIGCEASFDRVLSPSHLTTIVRSFRAAKHKNRVAKRPSSGPTPRPSRETTTTPRTHPNPPKSAPPPVLTSPGQSSDSSSICHPSEPAARRTANVARWNSRSAVGRNSLSNSITPSSSIRSSRLRNRGASRFLV